MLSFFKKIWNITLKKLPKHLISGQKGEKLALKYLRKHKYKILEHNWKSYPYELDIVCLHEDILVFIEVKTRIEARFDEANIGFHHKKQKSLINAVNFYLSQNDLWHLPCQIDLICIFDAHRELEHYRNVITFEQAGIKQKGQAQFSGYTPWQP